MTETDVLNTTSRFQLTEVPLVSPGKCAVCGSATKPVVDFGMTIQFYGAVLMCVECLSEASARIGMVPRSELEACEARLSQSFQDELNQRSLRVITDEQYELLSVAFASIFASDVSASDSSSSMVLGQAAETDVPAFIIDADFNLVEPDDSEPAIRPVTKNSNFTLD